MLARYGQKDTAVAIINLFAKRQGGGAAWLVTSGIATVRGYAASRGANQRSINGVVVDESDANPAPVFIIGGLAAGYGVSKLVRFSNGRLEETLTSYAAGKPLPTWVRRRLKPKFFQAPRRYNERK
ncbi:hypothetical protein GCM10023186_00660 [Hymenobacter koreensis]|uniref:Uncharacterized protein n=2 Tax=Hymenobacter koreensis TaxID=1084523 RepID=A0ABP8ITB2_9BACT